MSLILKLRRHLSTRSEATYAEDILMQCTAEEDAKQLTENPAALSLLVSLDPRLPSATILLRSLLSNRVHHVTEDDYVAACLSRVSESEIICKGFWSANEELVARFQKKAMHIDEDKSILKKSRNESSIVVASPVVFQIMI